MKVRTKSKKVNKAWLHDHMTDPYVKLAQKEGYRARAAYKLIEIDQKDRLIRGGSVIVDLAAEAGGNCECTTPGEKTVTPNGVTILGYRNWPGRIGVASSALYARNLLTFLTTFWDKDGKKPNLPESDDIVKGVMLTRGGAVVHPNFVPSQAA